MRAQLRESLVWDVLVRSWRLDPRMTTTVAVLIVAQVGAFAVTGLAMSVIVDAAAGGSVQQVALAALVGGLALGVAGIGGYVQFELRCDLTDRIGYLQFDPLIQRLASQPDGVEHFERPDHLDQLSLLRRQGQALAEAGWAVPEMSALALQVLVTLTLLGTVHPLLLLLGVCCLPALWLNWVAYRRLDAAALAAAEPARLERHLHEVLTDAGAGKEIRTCGAVEELSRLATSAWGAAVAPQLSARTRAVAVAATGSIIFLTGFALALYFVADLVRDGERSIGDLLLVIVLASQLRAEFQRAQFGLARMLAGRVLVGPFRWLRAYAAEHGGRGGRVAPARLQDGIRLEDLTFRYPGADRDVVGPITLDLPAGSTVALVGEHGSGKSTLVKLLCGMYAPRSGRISVDGTDLQDLDSASWRASTTAAFQEFARYQVSGREGIGAGDLSRADEDAVVRRAARDGGAQGFLSRLPDGFDTPLGHLFDGVDLSEGQWQSLALSRACMRTAPLLVVLDEPTASLDALTEHAVFERHAALARDLGARQGSVTLMISHRFSTVRMADRILVLAGGRIGESGTHEELLSLDGTYAELYRLQRRAYVEDGADVDASDRPVSSQA